MDTFLLGTALGYRPQTTQINGWAFAQRQELSGGAAFGGFYHSLLISWELIASLGRVEKVVSCVIERTRVASAVSVGVIIYVNVIHRRRQIGIMKAIGMKSSLIFTVFLMEALFLAGIGVAAGDVIGYLGTKYLESRPFYCAILKEYISAKFYTYLLYDASLVSSSVVVLAGIYPALIASRTNIIKAIWG